MRYLKPNEVPIMIGDNIYKILYTLNVIDILQDKTNMPIGELMSYVTEEKTRKLAVKCLLKYLIEDYSRRYDIKCDVDLENINDNEIDYYSIVLLNTYIEQSKPKETNQTKTINEKFKYLDIEYWFYTGTTLLGYQEHEVWNMTLGKLATLLHEHAEFNNRKQNETEIKKENIIAF